jgi:hypothetical protein
MGWTTLAKPGSDGGPCVDGCDHIDCAAMRLTASARCCYCGGHIGYDVPFYQDPERANAGAGRWRFSHARCLWQAADEVRKAGVR